MIKKNNKQLELRTSWWFPVLVTVLPSAVLPVGFAILINLFFDSARWANEPLHSLVEGVGSFAAIVLALFIVLMRNNDQLRPSYIWVATTLMGMGLLDGFHAAVAPGTAFVWLHSMATFVGGVTFALVVLPERISSLPRLQMAPYFMAAASVIFGIVSILFDEFIPVMTANGGFTATAEFLNIVGGIGFFIAWAHFAWQYDFDDQEERFLLANHCLLFGVAGALFHFSVLWDATWWLWHILRLFAYLVILWFFLEIYNQDVKRIRLAKQVIDSTSEAVVVTEQNGVIVDVNNAYLNVTGYERHELIGMNPNVNQSGKHDTAFYQQMWAQLATTGHWAGEIWDRRRNGEIYPKWLNINAIRNNRGVTTHYVGVFNDISEKKATEEKLRNLAFYDPLTSLANRALLRERIEKMLQGGQRGEQSAALLLIDLDGFKNVNDSLGHSAGDHLLIEVARRLEKRARKSDTVARLGGDEFCLLINSIDKPEKVASLAEQLIEVINEPITLESQSVHVGASIGVAFFPEDASSLDELFKHADIAMYQAKENGRNAYQFFLKEMNLRAMERLDLIHDLYKAMDALDFQLYYQPKFRIDDHSLIGMEALIRWPKEGGGMVSPAEFIPCAEETGLILPMGRWVLKEACCQTQRWNTRYGRELCVAVNLSTRQFQGEELYDDVMNVVGDADLAPHLLELEITESVLMSNAKSIINVIERFREQGISIAIDDFGTGYSSLSYLKHLPIDTLKIDQSFVRELESDTEDEAIVLAIISIAEKLGLKVVAEGVETEQQLKFLKQYRCDEAQGYLLGRPLPADEFEELLKGV